MTPPHLISVQFVSTHMPGVFDVRASDGRIVGRIRRLGSVWLADCFDEDFPSRLMAGSAIRTRYVRSILEDC